MSEEQAGGGTSIKNILIGLVSTVTLGVGGWFTSKLTGGDEKEAAPAAAAPVKKKEGDEFKEQAPQW